MPEDYTVEQGDCLNNLAFGRGFLWKTLWDHAQNADLKQRRKDPNVLMEGDILHIPDLTAKEESGATETKHKFRLKGVPAKMKLRLLIDDKPRANEPFTLYIDGVQKAAGQTDGNGYLEKPIPPNAREGKLVLGPADRQEVYEFKFGTVDPLEAGQGVRGRLHNLGYNTEDLPSAIRDFQEKEKLDVTGAMDDAARSRLKEKFGE